MFFHGGGAESWEDERIPYINEWTNRGYAFVFVDLYAARGLGNLGNGKGAQDVRMTPKHVAGDALVSFNWLKKQNWADPNKIVAMGYSYGAALLMDSLVFSAIDELPKSLLDKPKGGMEGLKGIAAIAPYCPKNIFGYNIHYSLIKDFSENVPMLAILPTEDKNFGKMCNKIVEKNQGLGFEIKVLRPKTTHGFHVQQTYKKGDQRFLEHAPEIQKNMDEEIFKFFEEKTKD